MFSGKLFSRLCYFLADLTRLVICLVLLVGLASPMIPDSRLVQGEKCFKKVVPSLVKVQTLRSSVEGKEGTGIIVDSRNGYILTASHAVVNAKEMAIIFRNGRPETAKVMVDLPNADLALLQTNAIPWPQLAFPTTTTLGIEDEVATIGIVYGRYHAYKGKAIALSPSFDPADRWPGVVANAAAIPGMSGGVMVTIIGCEPAGILIRGRGENSPGGGPTSVAVRLSKQDIATLIAAR